MITDQSLRVLGGQHSLLRVEFWEIAAMTDPGGAELARPPRFREISVEGSPDGTREGVRVSPAARTRLS